MPHPSRRTGAALVVAATATCLAAVAVPAAPALGDEPRTAPAPRTIRVAGVLELTNAAKGTYTARGDLRGTWTIPPQRATDYYNVTTTLLQKGTEYFRGCLGTTDACGTLNSDYISWAYNDADGKLIRGGCVHAPTGGTRAFRGVRGLIQMTDTPVGDDEVNTVYAGEIILNAAWDEGGIPVPRTPAGDARTTATSAAGGGSC